MFPLLLLLAAAGGGKSDADALLAAGRYAEAASSYVELLKQAPNDPLLLIGAGESFLGGGKPKQAILLFERAARLAPGDRAPLRPLAAALQEANHFDQAYPLLERLTGADPADAQSWFRLGLLMYQNGYYGAAIQDLDRALALGLPAGGPPPADRDRAEIARAVSLSQAGQAPEAAAAIRTLLASPRNSANLDLRLSLVQIEFEAQDYTPALADSEKALALDASNAMAHFWRARILQQQGQLAAAAAEAERARDLAPENPGPRSLLIRLYQKLGRPADATREADWQRRHETGR